MCGCERVSSQNRRFFDKSSVSGFMVLWIQKSAKSVLLLYTAIHSFFYSTIPTLVKYFVWMSKMRSISPASATGAGSSNQVGNKKLKIQLGVCKRMLKEVASYEKEVIDNEARIQKMRDDGKDPYGTCLILIQIWWLVMLMSGLSIFKHEPDNIWWIISIYINANNIDIRKQEEVLGESYMMVPDSKNRCELAFAELSSILVRGWWQYTFHSIEEVLLSVLS